MESHPSIGWPAIPSYTPLVEGLGRGFIYFAALAFLISIVSWAIGGRKGADGSPLEKVGKISFTLANFSLLGAFGVLVWIIYNRQYQFQYVFAHSDNWLPDGKRVASLWGGQEGSFLLWAVMASLFALASVGKTKHYRRWYTIAYSAFLGGLAGILSYESPFRLWQPPAEMASLVAGKMPPDGAGLTPALINWWMQIHPPTIFVGFGSLTVLFAWAIAALATGDLKSWTKLVRPWALVSMTFTGLGLCMGGFWAYETLGWGGFWMWDPVENAALVPWLVAVTFVHGLFVQIARDKWGIRNALIGGFGLITFIYGTFLTRSGFLGDASVHSFAEMDRQALWLLTSLGIGCAAGLVGLGGYRAIARKKAGTPSGRPLEKTSPFHLTAAYSWGITMLSMLALASAVGMSVPLIMSLSGQQPKIVEEALYNKVTPWFYLPLLVLMGAAPYLSWRGLPRKELGGRLSTALALSMGTLGIGMFLYYSIPQGMAPKFDQTVSMPWGTMPLIPWVFFLAWLSLFGIMANVVRIWETARRSPGGLGSFITHIGVITAMLGLIVSRGFQQKVEFNVQQGRPGLALGYTFSIQGITGKDFFERENRVKFRMQGRGEDLVAKPILFYTDQPNEPEPSPTVRPFIFHRPFHDLYVTLYPMVWDATEPTEFELGGRRQFEGTIIQYLRMTQKGEAGMMGTQFGALLRVTTPDGRTTEVNPVMEIGENGIRRQSVEVGDYFVELDRIDAATQSASIKLRYRNPILPMELYYKPLPGLVWWGTGIMTFGGLLAAWNRRRALRAMERRDKDSDDDQTTPPNTPTEDAPVTVAQV